MDNNNPFDDDNLEEDDSADVFINFSAEVQKAIQEVLPSRDPLDEPDFNSIDYINNLFPTEQSLSNIDEVVTKIENKITSIDNEISTVVRDQIGASHDGRQALDDAHKVIGQLFVHIKEIKERAEQSEGMVREITRDIKQLDCAKKNLTLAITTLNHLHMLVGGVETLKTLTQKRLYGEIALPLQAISEVMTHFEHYSDIPQIKQLSDEVQSIHVQLADQITHDFKEYFANNRQSNSKQLAQACLVVSILDERVKRDLLRWFVQLQLQEYSHLFNETEDTAWLDKIDKRYAWIKRHLLEFEERLGNLFPANWEVSERIAVQFCRNTKEQLQQIMSKRRNEIDVKLLLYAIQKTNAFETLLSKRFTGATLTDQVTADTRVDPAKPPFLGLIGDCFTAHLDIYIDSIDRNLADLIERFVHDSKHAVLPTETSSDSQPPIFPTCPDLFVYYKKSMIQCTQLDNGHTMLSLARTFQKYLHEYSDRILGNNLPKSEAAQGLQFLARDLPKISTSGLIQNFSSLMNKEGEIARLTKEEVAKTCCILSTAEYCLETTGQLCDKLKEKIEPPLADQIDFAKEQDTFHKVISNCIQILEQDLENACEPALTAMSKIQWQNVDTVGDQSAYITSIITHLKTTVPPIRNNLQHSRKYFTQFCIKFANSFIPKFTQNIYKCKPINTEGCEQLLLDTHMLKTILLNLPSISSQINRQPPASYTKVVTKGMTRAEMVLKVVMTPVDPSRGFVEQCNKLLPDCQLGDFCKILDMKNVKRQEQALLIDVFKNYK